MGWGFFSRSTAHPVATNGRPEEEETGKKVVSGERRKKTASAATAITPNWSLLLHQSGVMGYCCVMGRLRDGGHTGCCLDASSNSGMRHEMDLTSKFFRRGGIFRLLVLVGNRKCFSRPKKKNLSPFQKCTHGKFSVFGGCGRFVFRTFSVLAPFLFGGGVK